MTTRRSLYGVLSKPPKVHMNDHAPTLEENKAQFESGGSDGWPGQAARSLADQPYDIDESGAMLVASIAAC